MNPQVFISSEEMLVKRVLPSGLASLMEDARRVSCSSCYTLFFAAKCASTVRVEIVISYFPENALKLP